MNRLRVLKYALILIIPAISWFSFRQSGILAFSCLIFVYILVPFLELFATANKHNLEDTEEEVVSKDPLYDWLVYLMVPVLYFMLWDFLTVVSTETSLTWDLIGKIGAMGVLCGTFGINIGHELGHRTSKVEQFLAKTLLLSSLYMHFFIEHNRGHHKNVSTPNDPATGRQGELVYLFWLRSGFMSYLSAWRLENARVRKKYGSIFNLHNEMIVFQFIQIALLSFIFVMFGTMGLFLFLGAAVIGILQLETVNYIEHYGLMRKQRNDGTYERVRPWHSWNSNHVLGRLLLFELSRHSDHHYIATRKYPVLRYHEESPQMPTGYPGMMLMSLIPPIWFYVMHKAIKRVEAEHESVIG